MRRFLAISAVALLAAAGCTPHGGQSAGPTTTRPDGDGNSAELVKASLTRYEDCDDFTTSIKEQALDNVGPYGIEDRNFRQSMPFPTEMMVGAAEGDGAALSADGSPGNSDLIADLDYSTTNVQEVGIDEPDFVKTDGTNLYVALDDALRIFVLAADGPTQTSTIQLPTGDEHRLVIDGTRAVVISSGWGMAWPASDATAGASPDSAQSALDDTTAVTVVDISDRSAPSVLSQTYIEGHFVDARSIDGVTRIVTSSTPRQLDFVYPTGGYLIDELVATATNRSIIENTTAADWLPSYMVTSGPGSNDTGQPLVECGSVAHTEQFSGYGVLSVSTLDLRGDAVIDPALTASIQADGENVYASGTNLFVATSAWNPQSSATTEIHRFDISGPSSASYSGSARVRGTVLNQFSMSENDGVLRVATTDQTDQIPTADRPSGISESFVTTLQLDAAGLHQIGQVGGLGRGERIKSVRFIADTGYVVTFRQTDPLYTLDLSDPMNPRVVGELKIPGYSSYLHPIGDGRLVGLGQDATEQGWTTGLQVALFDVGDPANPRQIQKYVIPNGWSDAESNHHAFLWWPASNLLVIPLEDAGSAWDAPEPGDYFSGATGIEITDGAITERGRIQHPRANQVNPYDDGYWYAPNQILRALVVGDSVITVSRTGVATNALGDLSPRTWTPFS